MMKEIVSAHRFAERADEGPAAVRAPAAAAGALPTEIVPLVRTTAKLLTRGSRAAASCDIEVGGSSPAILADPEMLKIVFQNLLVNGAHAMKGQGRIRVDVSRPRRLPHRVHRRRPRHFRRHSREDLHAVLHDQVARLRAGPADRQAVDRSANGQIAIECPAAGGTTVTITLPTDFSASPLSGQPA